MDPNALNLPLRDIHLPNSISWWPLALGWWLLIALVIVLIILSAVVIKKLLKQTLKKQAIRHLKHIEESFQSSEDGSKCVSDLSVLMRRVVLSQKGFEKSAGVIGEAWLKLLDRSLKVPEFSQGVGQLLVNGPYQSQVEPNEVSELIRLCRKWVQCL